MRSGNLFSNRGPSVLDAPEPDRAPREGKPTPFKRRAAVTEMPLRRNASYGDDFAENYGDDFGGDAGFKGRARRPGIRLSFRGGLLPKSLWGRIAAGCGLLLTAGVGIAAALWVRSFLLHDEHFVVQHTQSIQIAGNSHLTRPQLLSVFGEDVDRNIFHIPLDERRAELESLPWVAHATVMRLLPNTVRVAIVERTPAAFVRQGSEIGLVDANGVLFDLPSPDLDPDSSSPRRGAAEYSFPVLSGISNGDPLSTRAARMKIYMDFVAALDASGEGVSHRLSEVNVSNPEDVQAILSDSDILVHFGDEKYLERYRQYQAHLAEWRVQYPKLASVDMRYEQQVVLQMQPGTAAPTGDSAPVAGTSGVSAPATAKPAVATAKKRLATKKLAALRLKPNGKPKGAALPGASR